MGHHSEAFVGIDTSKLRNAVAIADSGRGGEVRYLGEFPATEAAIEKLVAKLAAKYRQLTFCYEAGPTGYGLYRLHKSLGLECLGGPLARSEEGRRSSEDEPASVDHHTEAFVGIDTSKSRNAIAI